MTYEWGDQKMLRIHNFSCHWIPVIWTGSVHSTQQRRWKRGFSPVALRSFWASWNAARLCHAAPVCSVAVTLH